MALLNSIYAVVHTPLTCGEKVFDPDYFPVRSTCSGTVQRKASLPDRGFFEMFSASIGKSSTIIEMRLPKKNCFKWMLETTIQFYSQKIKKRSFSALFVERKRLSFFGDSPGFYHLFFYIFVDIFIIFNQIADLVYPLNVLFW